jgi:hypothetical protein
MSGGNAGASAAKCLPHYRRIAGGNAGVHLWTVPPQLPGNFRDIVGAATAHDPVHCRTNSVQHPPRGHRMKAIAAADTSWQCAIDQPG